MLHPIFSELRRSMKAFDAAAVHRFRRLERCESWWESLRWSKPISASDASRERLHTVSRIAMDHEDSQKKKKLLGPQTWLVCGSGSLFMLSFTKRVRNSLNHVVKNSASLYFWGFRVFPIELRLDLGIEGRIDNLEVIVETQWIEKPVAVGATLRWRQHNLNFLKFCHFSQMKRTTKILPSLSLLYICILNSSRRHLYNTPLAVSRSVESMTSVSSSPSK